MTNNDIVAGELDTLSIGCYTKLLSHILDFGRFGAFLAGDMPADTGEASALSILP